MALDDSRPGIRPRPTLGRRLDVAARLIFPGGITILLMLVSQLSLQISGQAALLPAVTFCCVWFWSVYRPRSMPPGLVFIVGIFLDLLGYLPLGCGVFTLLTVHGSGVALRRSLSQHGFMWLWATFAVVATVASALVWGLVMLLRFRLLPAAPALFTMVLSVSLFPLLALPFAVAHRTIADPERA